MLSASYDSHVTVLTRREMGDENAHFGAEDIGWNALGPAVACTILSTLVVAVRWYTRWRVVRCLGLDDYVILLSQVCCRM